MFNKSVNVNNDFIKKKNKKKYTFIKNCIVVWIKFLEVTALITLQQRWSRGHKDRGQGQGHKKILRPRPRTALPRTDLLEAKDKNARGQGPRTQAQVLSKKKKDGLQKNFLAISRKNRFQKIFLALHKLLTTLKIVLSSSQGQANF